MAAAKQSQSSKMKLSEELLWRGFINQTTFSDLSKLDGKKWTFYHGFDASADSQTVGNLAAMMFDKVFMRHGNKAIILAGGATSLIGDPGGKDSERPLQDETAIAHNVRRAENQLKKVFAGYDFILVNNLDWTKDLSVIAFLRDIGKHFSMTPLVQRDYIATRIGDGGSGISYAEFSYTILQGMDFLHLYDTYGCTLQLGGSDQWGNCLSGVELIRRSRSDEAHIITLPLIINKATGKKFGKSEAGAVWLDAEKTSPYQFYQFWLNSDDVSVEEYLRIFTELDKATIESTMKSFTADKGSRLAQRVLAYEVTKLIHGEKKADSVSRISEALFGKEKFVSLGAEEVDILKKELPVIVAKASSSLVEVIVASKLGSSKSDAQRLIVSGAISVNGEKADLATQLPIGHSLLKKGKNSFAVIETV